MKTKLKYTGNRAKSLNAFTDKRFREGPYDFSKGPCDVEEKDAKLIMKENPKAFEVLVKEVKKAPVKKAPVQK